MMSQAGGMDVDILVQRLRRLVTLDTSVFDEVRTDTTSTVPALVVAVLSTLAFGFGGWLWWVFADIPDKGKMFVQSLIFGSILSLLFWFIWIAITYVLLTQVFRARADVNEMIRVMGFATIPLALGLLMFIPEVDWGIGLLAVAMFFALTTIAVQSATDAPAGRALAANGAGFAIWAIVLGLLVTRSHAWAPGFFVLDRGSDLMRDLFG
jgi:Yip1 domain